ncbi:MAG: alpha/beta fold hydrolase, partial [Rubrivivax sp.]
MADFLLVHGAWHGAWCWRRLVPLLAQAGHRVHAVTLTGVGERAHLLSPAIDLETHITDVMAAMDAEEMDHVVLVVHSYAGMLGTAVADRRPGRLQHLVYLDAVLPKPGESWSSTHASATRAARIAAAFADPLHAFPAPDPSVFGLSADDHAWVMR